MDAITRAIEESKARPENIPAMPNLHDMQVEESELNNRLIIEADRIGKFTASEFHKLMTYEDKIDKLPAGAESYVMEKVGETLTESSSFNADWSTPEMDHGNFYELEAIQRFTKETGIEAQVTGDNQQFIPYTGEIEMLHEHVGGTPDGVINEEVGIEVKCPNTKTHLSYLIGNMPVKTAKEEFTPSLKMIEKKYYWQVQGCMMLTGKKAWYFVSYDPRIVKEDQQILIIRVQRDETDIQKLTTRLEMAVRRKIQIIQNLQSFKPYNPNPMPETKAVTRLKEQHARFEQEKAAVKDFYVKQLLSRSARVYELETDIAAFEKLPSRIKTWRSVKELFGGRKIQIIQNPTPKHPES